MTRRCRSQRGFLWAEMIVALTVLAALLISFALALHGFKQFNHYQWMRQQCLAAGVGATVNYPDKESIWTPADCGPIDPAGAPANEGQWHGLGFVGIFDYYFVHRCGRRPQPAPA